MGDESGANMVKCSGVVRVCLCGMILGGWLSGVTAFGDQPSHFNRDVRPILSDKCFSCHGPDEGSREADLRLDVRDELFADRGGYSAVVPGEPAESELINRISTDDDDLRMPPADFGEPLSAEEQNVLMRWIAEGAAWQDHWSFAPLSRPSVPELSDAAWCKNPIDRFVLARLRSAELRPSERTDQRTLVRRLFFDLTGLPPRTEDVEAFLNDQASDAYELLVGRLLDSPHYGERMAMYWLDLVRYADTLGYHGDQVRSVSPYRDYVIDAFNDNVPFDRFTIENLAGDLLPNATLQQRVASTYNRLNRASAEGGVQPKEYLAKYAADRVRTTASVWLGATLGCAECHDHKFDPFTTKDFYSFAAYFADIKELGIVTSAEHIEQLPVPTDQQARELQRLEDAITAVAGELSQRTGKRSQQFSRWQKRSLTDAGPWTLLWPVSASAVHDTTLKILEDGSILAEGTRPAKDVYTIEFSAPDSQLRGLRLELLTDSSLPAKGPGRAGNGNFVLQELTLEVAGKKISWDSATATHSQASFDIGNLAAGKKTGWAILPEVGKPSQAVFVAKELMAIPVEAEAADSATLRVTLTQNHGDHHTLGRFRFYSFADDKPLTVGDIVSEEVITALHLAPEERTQTQKDLLWQRFRDDAPELQKERIELARLKTEREALQKQVVTTLATAAGEPRDMRVLPRGNWMDDSGEVVEPSVPEFLVSSGVSERRQSRLDLARWIVSRENPLTARAFVNRIWMLFLGEGIARSVDDLGSQGQGPTHAELLDWMAVELIDSGWDVKHLVRLIVTSNTYRQSSRLSDKLREVDPYNLLLARQGRWRLNAELVRDNALAVSGLLVDQVGGESVKPYQPAGYWAQLNFPKRQYQHDANANQYRRGVYVHWQRTFLHPSLLAFDAPSREECTAKRDRSNTPLQALVLLNDPTYVEAARVLAARALEQECSDPQSRLSWIFHRVLQREPKTSEMAVLMEFYQRNLSIYQQDQEAAVQLLQVGLAPASGATDHALAASWTSVTRAILNLHETITRY